MSLVETPTIFGRMLTAHDVEQWVLTFLRRWSGTYIAEAERQHGYTAGDLQRVRGWGVTPSFDKWPEDQLPAVLVVSPGLIPPPVRAGDGVWRATWRIEIGCICSARTREKSHELAALYVQAHTDAIVQHPSLEGHAAGVDWLDLTLNQLDFDDTRSLYAGTSVFAVEVDNVVTDFGGPATPNDPLEPETDPWPLWPTVETVDVDVEHDLTKEE